MSQKPLAREASDCSTRTETSLSPRQRLLIRCRDTARKRFWRQHDRESYCCPICGYDGEALEVHHRDGDPLNNHLVNLIAICNRCHRAEHRRRATNKGISEWKASLPGRE